MIFHLEDKRYKCPDCVTRNTVFLGAQKDEVLMQCQSCGRRFKTAWKPMPSVDFVTCESCRYSDGKPIADGRLWCKYLNNYMRYCSEGDKLIDSAVDVKSKEEL